MGRKTFATAILLLMMAAAAIAAGDRTVTLAPDLKAVLDHDQNIFLLVRPHDGDAWSRLAKRVTGDGDRWTELMKLNGMKEKLTTEKVVRVPFVLAKPELQRSALLELFPGDRAGARGWTHEVSAGNGIEGESLWKIAEWLTGDGANYRKIREANPKQTLATHKGDRVLVPRELLSAAFRTERRDAQSASSSSSQNESRGGGRSGRSLRVATDVAEDDPPGDDDSKARTSKNEPPTIVRASNTLSASELEYVRSGERPYAIYHLKRGEALYSSVVIRFTGRIYSKDVTDAIDELVELNQIDDLAKLPVGYAVKIPLELLTAEYRPSDDPKRVERDLAQREGARLARRVSAKNLKGVVLVIDPGHGGRDVGTDHDGVWESNYVYDIACRLKKLVESRSDARVYVTTKSSGSGYRIEDHNVLEQHTDHILLTNPIYDLDDPIVGVNLRWYLANAIYRRAVRKGTSKEKVVFLSLHADSLHPSLRGLMAYVPGEQYSQGTFTKHGPVYLARDEVQQQPTVTLSAADALYAEGVSEDLADSIVDAFDERGLPVHPFDPVRDNVVRNGREWVPAVIRYNRIPTRSLIEVCNLGNAEDRKLIRTKKYRQQVAEAIFEGLVDYYEQQSGSPSKPIATEAAAR